MTVEFELSTIIIIALIALIIGMSLGMSLAKPSR
jgi:hypothetical protein